MKTRARMTALLVVLGLCLPSYGEILVYRITQNALTFSEQQGGEWVVDRQLERSFLVVDINDANGIDQAEAISFGTDAQGKFFTQDPLNLDLVVANTATRVFWIFTEKSVELSGQEITGGSFVMLTGLARPRGIGTGVRREAATKLAGFGLDQGGAAGGRNIDRSTLSATLSPTWTVRANGTAAGQANQDFDTTRQLIKADLTARGFVERQP